MERVTILESHTLENYKLYKVSPVGFIPFGSIRNNYCFDSASLAETWGVSLDVLNKAISYELSFKYSISVSIIETQEGLVKTYMIDARVVPSLLKKLKDSTNKPELDIIREHAVIATLIEKARRYKND